MNEHSNRVSPCIQNRSWLNEFINTGF